MSNMEKATDARIIGPGWWRQGRRLANNADTLENTKLAANAKSMFIFWVEFTKLFFKALDCKNHFEEYCQSSKYEDAQSYFVWIVGAHNEVNKRQGKKLVSIETARNNLKSNNNLSKFTEGEWAFLHQTALYSKNPNISDELVNIIRNIHKITSNSKEFSKYYKYTDEIDIFESTVIQHYGNSVTIEEADEIWNENNVKNEPCSGPELQEPTEEYEPTKVFDVRKNNVYNTSGYPKYKQKSLIGGFFDSFDLSSLTRK